MTVTYPRELHSCVRVAAIELVDNVVGSPSGGGKINLTQVDDPTWKLRADTWTLLQATRAGWSAWKNSLRGGLRTFVASDSRLPTPLAYPDAEVPADISVGWAGTAAVATLGLGGALSLSGLPAGYHIREGDRLGIEQGSPLRRGYYEALEDVTASGGGAASVTVAPFLHTGIFSPGATARLWRPKAEFIIDWTSWTEDEDNRPKYATVSFEAWQKL